MASLTVAFFLLPTACQLLLGLVLGLAITTPIRPVSATHSFDWTPSISLTDDSGEPDGKGMCPDIAGFGSGLNCERLQAHSCKPQGSDTQFGYDQSTQSIFSINYSANCDETNTGAKGGCVAAVDGVIELGASLRLSECDGSLAQQFVYAPNGQLQLTAPDGEYFCLAAGSEVRAAGRYWASDLLLGDCVSDLALTQWTLDNELSGQPADKEDEGGFETDDAIPAVLNSTMQINSTNTTNLTLNINI